MAYTYMRKRRGSSPLSRKTYNVKFKSGSLIPAKGEPMPKPVDECIRRKWKSGTRPLCLKIDEKGRGELKTPNFSIGLSSSRDVARLNQAISEAKTTGASSFIRDDGRPITVWRGEDGSINIQGVGKSYIHIPSMEDVAKLQRLLHKHFEEE